MGVFWSALTRRFGNQRRLPARKQARPRFRPVVEGLEERALLTIVVPTPGVPGPVTITGTSGADDFRIRLASGNPAVIEFSDNGGSTFVDSALADVTNIVVNGLGSGDLLK